MSAPARLPEGWSRRTVAITFDRVVSDAAWAEFVSALDRGLAYREATEDRFDRVGWEIEDARVRSAHAFDWMHVVDVWNRDDGVYVFADEDDADAFAEAVEANGGSAAVTPQVLIMDPAVVAELVRGEDEDEDEDSLVYAGCHDCGHVEARAAEDDEAPCARCGSPGADIYETWEAAEVASLIVAEAAEDAAQRSDDVGADGEAR